MCITRKGKVSKQLYTKGYISVTFLNVITISEVQETIPLPHETTVIKSTKQRGLRKLKRKTSDNYFMFKIILKRYVDSLPLCETS